MLRFLSSHFQLVLIGIIICILSCSKDNITDNTVREEIKTDIIAHRGYWWGDGCENSIESLRRAAELGVDGVEIDLRVTQDDSVIIFHDATIKGLTISQSSFKQIREFRLKNGEQVPTLCEYLSEASLYPDLELFLELKTADGIPRIMNIINSSHLSNSIVFISFLQEALEIVKREVPDAKLGYIRSGGQCCYDPEKLPLEYSYLVYSNDLLNSDISIIATAKQLDMEIIPWLVDSPTDYNKARETGFKYVISNRPDLLLGSR